MSDSGPWNVPQLDQSSGSARTMASRYPYASEPMSSKRVSFYKSGDPQFSALRMVINSRTFKTFDALLDSLSKKVPLPFGVRYITTPRGVHAVQNLEELEDGKAYICSDQKKIKPFDLDMADRKLRPWYNARPLSARRWATQPARRNVGRTARRDGLVVARAPKKLTVFRNGDPGRKHTIVLQRKTTPTFESLLDYVSEVLQFRVVKLHTPDGRRVDGLPGLILCSGAVVAAGREQFKPGRYSIQKPSPFPQRRSVYSHMEHNRLMARKKKILSTSSKSRIFSPSSERYIVSQINNSVVGRYLGLPSNPMGSMDRRTNVLQSMEPDTRSCTDDVEQDNHIVPPDDDIEKSFRINPDGSMTVEMKVRLTVKEEEIVHWTTTLSRCSMANQHDTGCVSQGELSADTPDSNCIPARDKEPESEPSESSRASSCLERKKGDLHKQQVFDTETEGMDITCQKQTPTPGVRGVQKQVSVESVKTVLETEAQDIMAEATSGQVAEESHMMRKCNGQLKATAGKVGSEEMYNNSLQSTLESSSVAEVLQIQNNGEEITETVLHIYEHQSYHDNFLPNAQYRVQSRSMYGSMHVQQSSSDTSTCSLSNGHDMELQRPHTTSECLTGRKTDSFSCVPSDLNIQLTTQSHDIAFLNNCKENTETDCFHYFGMPVKGKKCLEPISRLAKDDSELQHLNRKKKKPSKSQKESHLSTNSNKKQKESIMETSKKVKGDILGSASYGKRSENTSGAHGAQQNKTNSSGTTHRSPLPEKTLELNTDKLLQPKEEPNIVLEEDVPEKMLNSSTDKTTASTEKKGILDKRAPAKLVNVKEELMRQTLMHDVHGGMKETEELNEHILLSALSSSDSALTVEHCSKKIRPQPNLLVFQTGSDGQTPLEVSEINNDISKVNRAVVVCRSYEESDTEESQSHASVVNRLSAVPGGDSHNAGESGCVKFTTGSVQKRTHGASIRTQAEADEATLSRQTELPEMRTVLSHLSQSIQAVWQSSQHKRSSCLQKSQSVPDFSSHVASTYGSPSEVALALLSMLAAAERVPDFNTNNADARRTNCTEVLKLMETLQKIASIEDANLTCLQKSTSCQLMQSWRAVQEFSDKVQNHTTSCNNSDLAFLCGPYCGGCSDTAQQPYDNHELIMQIGVSEHFHKFAALMNGLINHINLDESQSRNLKEAGTITESITNNSINSISELIRGGTDPSEFSNENDLLIEDTLATGDQARNVQEDTFYTEAKDSYSEDKNSSGGWSCYIDRWAASSEENNNSVKVEELESYQEHKLNCVDYSSKQVVSVNEQIRSKSSVEKLSGKIQKPDSYAQEMANYDEKQHTSERELGDFQERTDYAKTRACFEKHNVNTNVKTPCRRKQNTDLRTSSSCGRMHVNEKDVISKEKASSVKARVNAQKSAHKNISVASEVGDIINISDPNKTGEFIRDTAEVCVKEKSNAVSSVHKDAVLEGDCRRHSASQVPQAARTLPDKGGSAKSVQISTSLAFSYDSRSSLTTEHAGPRVKAIKEMFLARNNMQIQCGHKQLPSPNTSDLSDYRSGTSDSGGYKSQTSADMSTESGEDDSRKQTIAKGFVRKAIERLYGKSEISVKKPTGKRPYSGVKSKRKGSPGNNSVGSLISTSEEAGTKVTTDLSYFNATSTLDIFNDIPQYPTINGHVAMNTGALGEWKRCGLRDTEHNQKATVQSVETQAGVELKSAEVSNESDDVMYSHFGNHQPPAATVSPSEEVGQTAVPKCAYLSLPMGSDRLQDGLGNESKNEPIADGAGKDERDARTSSAETVTKPWAEQNGSISLLPDNKVHPLMKPSAASATKPVHEQDPLEMLYFVCGQHCPIL